MNDEPKPKDSRSSAVRRAVMGYHSRLERRTVRRTARRRKTLVKLGYTVGPALALIAVIVVLFTVLGGPEEGVTTTTLGAGQADGNGLLMVEQDDTSPVMVLLRSRGKDGLILGMPGITLLKTTAGFETLAALHASGQDEELGTALTEAFGVPVGAVASVQWRDLRGTLIRSGTDSTLALLLTSAGEEAGAIADALLVLMGGSDSAGVAEIWAGLKLEGDSSGFRAAAGAVNSLLSTGDWTAVALTGKYVEGVGFAYFEPEVERASALLAGTAQELTVTVEVQNGSGVVGIAEQAGALLEPLGYTLLPFRNADDFPDVKQTRITVSPDAVSEGERVRSMLGVGTIMEDGALASGHVVVVLGKDYVPPASTDTGPTG